jgi:NAD(P)H-flavin reductase
LQRNVAGPKDILGEVYLGKQLPKLLVDGPYASPFDQVWNYPVVILASGGIGATPFASILRHVK